MFGSAKGGHFGVHPAAGCPGGVCHPAAGTKAGPAGAGPVGGRSDAMWRLRCKVKDGTHLLQGLSSRSRVRELQGQIAAITGIGPSCQRILVGYPPEDLDLSNGETVLGDLPIQSGKGIEAGARGSPAGEGPRRGVREPRHRRGQVVAGPPVALGTRLRADESAENSGAGRDECLATPWLHVCLEETGGPRASGVPRSALP